MKRITRTQVIEELTKEALQYYIEHLEVLEQSIQFGSIGFGNLSNEELVLEYMDIFEEEVEIG